MKLIGLMTVRNEDWVLGCSLRAALQWCDEVILVDHSSSDGTYQIFHEVSGVHQGRIRYSRWPDTNSWDEMEMRQHSLLMLRKYKGTHAAIIDADEVITANVADAVRGHIARLNPGECLEVPMLSMRSLDGYQDDDSVWSRAWLTVAFKDIPTLSWQPDVDGYEHHHRAPYGVTGFRKFLTKKTDGGVMHLQFANERRLLAKHVLYRMADYLRWPGRETVNQLNAKYDQALIKPGKVTTVPSSWWSGHSKGEIDLSGVPWQEAEIHKLIRENGIERFDGLDLKGFDK